MLNDLCQLLLSESVSVAPAASQWEAFDKVLAALWDEKCNCLSRVSGRYHQEPPTKTACDTRCT